MPQPEELSQVELAKRLGISPRAVRKLHGSDDRPGIPRGENGSYPWPEARNWYLDFKKNEQARRHGGGGGHDFQKERARFTATRADLAELQLAEKRGELIHIRDVAELLRVPLEQANSTLKNAPARHAARLAEEAKIPTPVAMRMLEEIVELVRADLRAARHDSADRVA